MTGLPALISLDAVTGPMWVTVGALIVAYVVLGVIGRGRP